jgi:hypothetical protein
MSAEGATPSTPGPVDDTQAACGLQEDRRPPSCTRGSPSTCSVASSITGKRLPTLRISWRSSAARGRATCSTSAGARHITASVPEGFAQGLHYWSAPESCSVTSPYAVATLAAGGSERYVSIPDDLLTVPSAVLAFVLVVRLSPNAMTPEEAARRIGVRSRKTARRIYKAAMETQLIADRKVAHGRIEVARGGHVFTHLDQLNQVGKNVLAKNVMAKNVTAHSSLEEATVHCKEPQNTDSKTDYPTRAPAERGADAPLPEERDRLEGDGGSSTSTGTKKEKKRTVLPNRCAREEGLHPSGDAQASANGADARLPDITLTPWVTVLERDKFAYLGSLADGGTNLDDAGGFITHAK